MPRLRNVSSTRSVPLQLNTRRYLPTSSPAAAGGDSTAKGETLEPSIVFADDASEVARPGGAATITTAQEAR